MTNYWQNKKPRPFATNSSERRKRKGVQQRKGMRRPREESWRRKNPKSTTSTKTVRLTA
jgi:hypothetical protein